MNIFATIETAVTFRKVQYYTLLMEGDEDSLFLQFLNSVANEEKHQEDLAIIREWLRKLGEEVGAQLRYFRPEGSASALPPPAQYIQVDCNLRLYCMHINPHVVILFSGGEKTTQTAQACPNVGPHFRLANRLSAALDRAIRDKDLQLSEDGRKLIHNPDFEIEI